MVFHHPFAKKKSLKHTPHHKSYVIEIFLKLNLLLILVYMIVSSRGYSGTKLTENVQCEIFQTILEEARESYRKEIVHELNSNTPDEMETNLDQIEQWVQQWTG